MSVYKSNCFPHCNEIIDTNLKKNTIKLNIDKNFGNPLKICPYCKKEYLDDNIHEPAMMSPSDLYFTIFTSVLSTIAVVVVISILIGSYMARFMSGNISSQVNDAAIIKFVVPLIIIISAISFKVCRPLNLKSEVNLSLERLKDENYVKTLIKLNKDIVSSNSAYAKSLQIKKNTQKDK